MKTTTIALPVLTAAWGLAAGCAALTPAQELAWDRWKACDHFATIQMTQIRTTGQLVVTGREHEAGPFTACVQQAAADQGRQGAAVGDVTTTVVMGFEGAQPK